MNCTNGLTVQFVLMKGEVQGKICARNRLIDTLMFINFWFKYYISLCTKNNPFQ